MNIQVQRSIFSNFVGIMAKKAGHFSKIGQEKSWYPDLILT